MVDFKRISWVFDELVEWMPDLVISDCEPVTAYIAKTMGVDLWYCSPMLQLTGLQWKSGQGKMLKQISTARSHITKLPKASKYLVYSPFHEFNGPKLKDGFEWVTPYTEALDEIPHKCLDFNPSKEMLDLMEKNDRDLALTTGETSYLSEILKGGCYPMVIGNADCPEAILNAELCRIYGVGDNLGKISKKSFDRIKKQIEEFKFTGSRSFPNLYPALHRKIYDYAFAKECGS
jgi:hypothetical protein